MSEKITRLTVVFDDDASEYDIASTVKVIQHLRGVAGVAKNAVDEVDYDARCKVRMQVSRALMEIIGSLR